MKILNRSILMVITVITILTLSPISMTHYSNISTGDKSSPLSHLSAEKNQIDNKDIVDSVAQIDKDKDKNVDTKQTNRQNESNVMSQKKRLPQNVLDNKPSSRVKPEFVSGPSQVEAGLYTWNDLKDSTNQLGYADNSILKVNNKSEVEYLVKVEKHNLDNLKNKLHNLKIVAETYHEELEILEVDIPLYLLNQNEVIDLDTIQNTEIIEPNYYYQTMSVNDTKYDEQYALNKINIEEAWDIETGSDDILVGVIDTGVDMYHPELIDNYVDLGYDWYDSDDTPYDPEGHGTHVAGTIAAEMNNSLGVAGVADVNFFAERFLGDQGGSLLAGIKAINHGVAQGADILSNSWGAGGYSTLLEEAVQNAIDEGVMFIAAAGNTGDDFPQYPAAFDGVISVGASNNNDEIAQFSTWGDWVDIAAPGVDILSTFPSSTYGSISGTSMATPHVSGLAALLMSKYPNYSNTQIENILLSSADDIGNFGYDQNSGWGRINAKTALETGLIENNLAVKLDYPEPAQLGQHNNIKVSVFNFGTSPVSNVTVEVLLDSNILNTGIVENIPSFSSNSITFDWQPNIEGNYSLQASIEPIPGESNIQDNYVSHDVNVLYLPHYYPVTTSYNWLDAKTNGYNLNMYSGATGVKVDLPFKFKFYDEIFDKIYVSTNGYISFHDRSPRESNLGFGSNIPSDRPYTIAAYVDNLVSLNNVYAWETNDFVVIEYHNQTFYSSVLPFPELGQFQIILYKNGSIKLQYDYVKDNTDTQQFTENDAGLNYGYNDDYHATGPSTLNGTNNIAYEYRSFRGDTDLAVDIQRPDRLDNHNIEKMMINGSITNIGQTTISNSNQLGLYINNTEIHSWNISLGPGESMTVSFNWFTELGYHKIMYWAEASELESNNGHIFNNYDYFNIEVSNLQNYKIQETEFEWFNASKNGVNLGMNGDDVTTTISLPFDFKFYDQTFNQLTISSNGVMGFVPDDVILHPSLGGNLFPNSYQKYIISPLSIDMNTYDDIYAWNVSTHSVVVEYNNMLLGGDESTFQVILNVDDSITFQYLRMSGEFSQYGYDTYNHEIGLNYGLDMNLYSDYEQPMEGRTNFALRFVPQPYIADLETTIQIPNRPIKVGNTYQINATVQNVGDGVTFEGEIEIMSIDKPQEIISKNIPLLDISDTYTITYNWTPNNTGLHTLAANSSYEPDLLVSNNYIEREVYVNGKVGIIANNGQNSLPNIVDHYRNNQLSVNYINSIHSYSNFSSYNLIILPDGAKSLDYKSQYLLDNYLNNGGKVAVVGSTNYNFLTDYNLSFETTNVHFGITDNILAHQVTKDIETLYVNNTDKTISQEQILATDEDGNGIISKSTKNQLVALTFDLDQLLLHADNSLILENLISWGTYDYPVLSHPKNKILETSELNTSSINWNATDNNPDQYTIFKNGNQIDTGTWISGVPITVQLVGLEPGSYTYKIEIRDQDNNMVSDQVQIGVIENDTTVSTTTIDSSSTIDEADQETDGFFSNLSFYWLVVILTLFSLPIYRHGKRRNFIT